MAATIRDITRLTGLSVATVSKYLNGGNVLPENRERIENAIKELKYEVNEIARGLATSKTKTIGILIPFIDNVFASSIIASVIDILRRYGYGTFVCDCHGDLLTEQKEINFLLSKRVDGIITIPMANNSSYLSAAAQRGVPVVLIDRTFENAVYDSVLSDNFAASFEAVSLLLGRGHRRIGILCGTQEFYTARERLHGYTEALKSYQVPVENQFVLQGELSVQHGYDGMKRLISLPNRPTAVYMTNYEITLGAIIALNELGIRFPDDLSVIGFDNLILSQIVKPRLWMVVQPMKEIAETAAHVMLKRLEDGVDSVGIIYKLKTSLLQGDSIREA
jgi:LacI family transcriptional regulator